MAMDSEKMAYLLRYFDNSLEEFVANVLANDPVDPHYSAVTATNCIKCYIEWRHEIGEPLPYSNIEEYFRWIGYSEEEYRLFESSRAEESEHYIGVQY